MTTAIDTTETTPATQTSLAEDQAAGLRRLADFIEEHPEFTVNEYNAHNIWLWHIYSDAQTLARMIHIAGKSGVPIINAESAFIGGCNLTLDFGGVRAVIMTYLNLLDEPVAEPPAEGMEIGAAPETGEQP